MLRKSISEKKSHVSSVDVNTQCNIIEKNDNDKRGIAMTTWWLFLTILVIVYSYGHVILGDNIWFNCIRGCCAVSGLCVGVGYHVFMVCFNYVQTPTLSQQFYEKSWKSNGYTYFEFIVIDCFVHIFACGSIYILWIGHITMVSTCLAFILHRVWSIVNSSGKTCYFQGDVIYNFNKPMPAWVWIVVYGVENSICLLFIIMSIIKKKYV